MAAARRYRSAPSLFLSVLLCLCPRTSWAQASFPNDRLNYYLLETEAVGPQRFIAVHGRRSLIQGYASHGLEVWAYPLQIVSGYEVGFRKQGSTTETSGPSLLRKITYEPEAITRTYIGPDFIVRERLFVPLEQPAALVTYTVDSKSPLEIVVRFTPVLNLMWPGSIGGQETTWNRAAKAYVLFEPSHRFSAFVGSPDMMLHDETVNSAQPEASPRRFAFAMKAGGASGNRSPVVVLGLLDKAATDTTATMNKLLAGQEELEREAHAHYVALESSTVQVVTPDETVNRAVAWAGIALDQAWVCNPDLGCGSVAGYGPSRDARRPQYEWFFAGDMLTTIGATLASGQYDRARDVFRFILKYQDPKTGMIWHELSQSASLLDWASAYPYMFVHVDITFQFLNAVARYVSTTGDTQFVTDNWNSLQAAYDYCKSLISSEDGLPRIPANKQGANEQDRLTDDLGLSVSWLTAAQSYAQLAQLAGHTAEAGQAKQFSERTRKSIAGRYWTSDRSGWIDGYTSSGKPILGRGIGGINLIDGHLLNQAQNDSVLDQIASSDFQTDWGTRSIASRSPDFDPSSYAKGSVWAFQTARVASTYWAEHRPYTAFSIWNSLIPWNSLDSLGHMHEVLAGDFYYQQTESVPEQTWSSAGLLSSTIFGLLGLEVNAQTSHVTFAPHLPAEWDAILLNRVKFSRGTVALTMAREKQGLELTVNNNGDPATLRFSPEIPFGAHVTGATINNKPVRATQEDHDQDSHAVVVTEIPHGMTHILVSYEGGIALSVPQRILLPGEQSHGVKITEAKYKGPSLVIGADVVNSVSSTILLRTGEKILRVEGATIRASSDGVSELVIAPVINIATNASPYRHAEVLIELVRAQADDVPTH